MNLRLNKPDLIKNERKWLSFCNLEGKVKGSDSLRERMPVVLTVCHALSGGRYETIPTVSREWVAPEGWNMSIVSTRYKAHPGWERKEGQGRQSVQMEDRMRRNLPPSWVSYTWPLTKSPELHPKTPSANVRQEYQLSSHVKRKNLNGIGSHYLDNKF